MSHAVGTSLPVVTKIAQNVHRRDNRTTEANIHDDAAAQKMGFSRGLVAGGQSIGMMHESILAFFGPAYLESGRFQATYVAPVFEGDTVHIKGEVTDQAEEEGGSRVTCNIWIEKEDGTKAVVAVASARL